MAQFNGAVPLMWDSPIRINSLEFNDFRDAAIQDGADFVQHKAVVADNLVFIVFIDNVILDARSLCQLIPGHLAFG